MNKYGLGKGLGALIPNTEPLQPQEINDTTPPARDAYEEYKQSVKVPIQMDDTEEPVAEAKESTQEDSVLEVSPEDILPNPYQPRKVFDPASLHELSDSIVRHGIIQPLVVTRRPDGKYELVAGERRLQASKLAGLAAVPVIVRKRELDDQQKLELAIIENVQRADLNIIEQAKAFQRLHDEFRMTYEEIADKVGKSRPAVSNIVRLIQLPVEIQRALMDGKLAEGHGRALLQVAERERQFALFELIIKKKLTTEQALDIAKEWTVRPHLRRESPGKTEEIKAWENLIRSKLNARRVDVEVADNGGGKIHISFLSQEEFESLVEKLNSI